MKPVNAQTNKISSSTDHKTDGLILNILHSRARSMLIVLVLFFVSVIAVYPLIPPNRGDWALYFLPATRAIINGQTPYCIDGFYNPPWTLLPLIPLALLPAQVGSAILFVLHPFAFALIAYKLGAKLPVSIAVGLSWPALMGSININFAFLPMIGLLLPPWLGIFFLLMKPQMGICAVLFLVYTAWRKNKIYGVFQLVAPLVLVLNISFILYGFWPAQMMNATGTEWHNSFFPLGVPIGATFLLLAIHRNDILMSVPASLFVTPYYLTHTTIVVFFGFINSTRSTLILFVSSWIWAFIVWFG